MAKTLGNEDGVKTAEASVQVDLEDTPESNYTRRTSNEKEPLEIGTPCSLPTRSNETEPGTASKDNSEYFEFEEDCLSSASGDIEILEEEMSMENGEERDNNIVSATNQNLDDNDEDVQCSMAGCWSWL